MSDSWNHSTQNFLLSLEINSKIQRSLQNQCNLMKQTKICDKRQIFSLHTFIKFMYENYPETFFTQHNNSITERWSYHLIYCDITQSERKFRCLPILYFAYIISIGFVHLFSCLPAAIAGHQNYKVHFPTKKITLQSLKLSVKEMLLCVHIKFLISRKWKYVVLLYWKQTRILKLKSLGSWY